MIISRIRGERRREVYHAFRELGSRRRWLLLVTNRSKIRKLRKELREEPRLLTNLKDSAMRRLIANLSLALFTGKADCPNGVDRKEWVYNLRLAKKRIGSQRGEDHSLGKIVAVLLRRYRRRKKQDLCRSCHTPILVGYLLDGHKVTRRRKYCDEGCKMRDARCRQNKRW